MDPNANLQEQARLLDLNGLDRLDRDLSLADKRRLRELREALQEWRNRGGFDPQWYKFPHATRAFTRWQANHRKFLDLYR
jgi:hypothetical protein